MKNILIDLRIHAGGLERLKKIPGIDVRLTEPGEEARLLPAELIRDRHVLLCTCPPTNVADMSALELLQIASAGYSQLYGLGLAERGVRACNGLGNFDVPIAEWNLAMMVNLARNLRGLIRHQEKGVWDRSAVFQREIRGATVGIWGYGGIGRETARLAKAFGLAVHVMTRHGVGPRDRTYGVPGTGDPDCRLPDRVFIAGQELSFLAGLDFLVLAMPLTKHTEGLIGESELRALPRTAFLLNPARGKLIREDALLRALREGWIAGAALDTHHHYPMPPDHPLWHFPNVIMTPHISGSAESPKFLERIWENFAENVTRFVAGDPLLNELTPAQLAGE
ncbi:MAG: D-2-hydroxyacid dehydrogenase [Opitutus sp.]|nr:D-2-hydroxyacid dehydrogenase [Opitutus sp.]